MRKEAQIFAIFALLTLASCSPFTERSTPTAIATAPVPPRPTEAPTPEPKVKIGFSSNILQRLGFKEARHLFDLLNSRFNTFDCSLSHVSVVFDDDEAEIKPDSIVLYWNSIQENSQKGNFAASQIAISNAIEQSFSTCALPVSPSKFELSDNRSVVIQKGLSAALIAPNNIPKETNLLKDAVSAGLSKYLLGDEYLPETKEKFNTGILIASLISSSRDAKRLNQIITTSDFEDLVRFVLNVDSSIQINAEKRTQMLAWLVQASQSQNAKELSAIITAIKERRRNRPDEKYDLVPFAPKQGYVLFFEPIIAN